MSLRRRLERLEERIPTEATVVAEDAERTRRWEALYREMGRERPSEPISPQQARENLISLIERWREGLR